MMSLCDYCGTPVAKEDEYRLVHGHQCNNSFVSSIGNVFANTLAAMMGGETREKVYIVHKECISVLFVHREIRRKTK